MFSFVLVLFCRTSGCGEKVICKINSCQKKISSPFANLDYFQSNSAAKYSVKESVIQKYSKLLYGDKIEQTTEILLEAVKKSESSRNIPQLNKNEYTKLPNINLHQYKKENEHFQDISNEHAIEQTASIHLETISKSVCCSNISQFNKHDYTTLPKIHLYPNKAENKHFQNMSNEQFVEKTTCIHLVETVNSSVSSSNKPKSNKNYYSKSKLPILNLHPDKADSKHFQGMSKKHHLSNKRSNELLDYESKTNKCNPFSMEKSQPNDSSKLPVLIKKPSKEKYTHWTEKFEQFKEKQRRMKNECVNFSNIACQDAQTNKNKEIYNTFEAFAIAEVCASADNLYLNKRNRLSPILSASTSISSSNSSLDFENKYVNFNCLEGWTNKTSSEQQFHQVKIAEDVANVPLKTISDNAIFTAPKTNGRSSTNNSLYNSNPAYFKSYSQHECFEPIPLKRNDTHTNLLRMKNERYLRLIYGI